MVSPNDILRRLRFIFDLNDNEVIVIFKLGDTDVTRAQISDWLKKDDDPSFKKVSEEYLGRFLDGLIIKKRGKKDGPVPPHEKRLTNNIILRKLKIALNLKDEDIIEILALADFRVSRHEISALFRKPDQEQYRLCKDQILRNFIQGLQMKYQIKQ
jgi:uncharacterized protein YehS (DUF1456 family)